MARRAQCRPRSTTLERRSWITSRPTARRRRSTIGSRSPRSGGGPPRAPARALVSSSKGALGHWVAGAGALGALYAWEAVTRGTVLPTAGLVTPDPQCDVEHVIGRAAVRDVRVALANSFAFGGANSCLVLR